MTIIVECAWCRRVKDKLAQWYTPLLSAKEVVDILGKDVVEISHGICPECAKIYLGDETGCIEDMPTRKEVNEDAQTK